MEQKLFKSSASKPLAQQLRPSSFEEFVGQQHLVDKQSILHTKQTGSCLLWGPPGCGKTTLAHLLAIRYDAKIVEISPVTSGVPDLRNCVEQAIAAQQDFGTKTVVLVDEAHRFNKAQQDYFLPHVESGLLTFIGTTTENPSFEINSALLSRVTVYRLNPLSHDELIQIIERAQQFCSIKITDEAKAILANNADGDARRLLNLLERLVHIETEIDVKHLEQLNVNNVRRFDKRGDDFYDQISAMIKSIRGSDPDAALYWLCRMLDAGADPKYVSRRLIRSATEDIGLADPHALTQALNGDEQYRRLGSPEGELGIAQACVYLACAPKSNAVYKAFKQMNSEIENNESYPVPMHLRNAPTQLLKDQGNAQGYKYAHDEKYAYVPNENYLPKELASLKTYHPTNRGFEQRITERMEFFRNLDAKDTKDTKDTKAKKDKNNK